MLKNCQGSRKSGILALGNRLRTPTQGWTPLRDPGEYTPTYLSLGESRLMTTLHKGLITNPMCGSTFN